MIYIIKQEGLYQKKMNCSLVWTCNCKIGYPLPSPPPNRPLITTPSGDSCILHGNQVVCLLWGTQRPNLSKNMSEVSHMVSSTIQLISNHHWHLMWKISNFLPTNASTFPNFKGKPCETNRFKLTWQWLKIRSYTNPVVIADCPTWIALWVPIAAYPPSPTLVWYSFLTVSCGVVTYSTETTK